MRKTTFWAAIVAGALMFVGVAGWANSDKRALEAQASTPIEAVDAFQMMLNAKNLPSQEFGLLPGISLPSNPWTNLSNTLNISARPLAPLLVLNGRLFTCV